MSFQCWAKIFNYPNFECILDRDILIFKKILKSIILKAILCYVFAVCIGEFVNKYDSCLFIHGILKSISILQLFSQIMSQPVCFYNLKFWFYQTEKYVTNIIFTFNVVSSLDNHFIRVFLLTLGFGIIFELYILKNNWYQLRVIIV